jgi:hypothetical protein
MSVNSPTFNRQEIFLKFSVKAVGRRSVKESVNDRLRRSVNWFWLRLSLKMGLLTLFNLGLIF